MNVLLPVLYWPSSSTLGLASKSPSLSSGLQVKTGAWGEGEQSNLNGLTSLESQNSLAEARL
jgi:hypothetical protein